jgi:2-oxoisovalerate dehydrogenase E1 component
VVEIMWADFLLVALDQLVNQAANVRYVSRSELTAPLVVRTQQGATPGSCAQHSQNLEALLAHIPGLKIGLAATPGDAYAMLRSAIADPDPVILVEARGLYQSKGLVDRSAAIAPVGGARVHGEGADIVLLTWGALVPQVVEAADRLARQDVDATVVDLRWLNPLDDETIERVVRAGSGRVLVAHEANVTGGFGAEVAARIQEQHFDYLDQPVARLGVPDSRIPSAPALQRALLPDADAVVRTVVDLVADRPTIAR